MFLIVTAMFCFNKLHFQFSGLLRICENKTFLVSWELDSLEDNIIPLKSADIEIILHSILMSTQPNNVPTKISTLSMYVLVSQV